MNVRRFVLLLFAFVPVGAFASSVVIRVLPNSPAEYQIPVAVHVTDEGFGKHFSVTIKNVEKDSDEFINATLKVAAPDKQISTCSLEKKWDTNCVRFEFTVAPACLFASKFEFYEFGHVGKQAMPSFTCYWFYLRDFATNATSFSPSTNSSTMPATILAKLPKRVRHLHPGMVMDEIWKELGLAAYQGRIGGEVDLPTGDQYFLNWNHSMEFDFAESADSYTVIEGADGHGVWKDNRKLIRAILFKNGLEVCRSGK